MVLRKRERQKELAKYRYWISNNCSTRNVTILGDSTDGAVVCQVRMSVERKKIEVTALEV